MDIIEPEAFQITRRWRLYLKAAIAALFVGLVVAAVASVRGPQWLWGVAGALLVLGLVALPGIVDRQTPMMVVDDHGVRLRNHAEWVGLLWSEIAQVIVEPGSMLRDAVVKVVTADGRHVYTTPVGFTTDVSVADAETQLARRRATNAY